ncbi:hypothetical protein CEXT_639641 [Caerostris extrusa]|uniref:Ycf15 n=1 Tax=Caerostris extrusa TaxID=172846 RepID=A0AAV4MEL9_CAEEX|nr:hypothetical protein CEXT_639641 [Caerostris extrusa]
MHTRLHFPDLWRKEIWWAYRKIVFFHNIYSPHPKKDHKFFIAGFLFRPSPYHLNESLNPANWSGSTSHGEKKKRKKVMHHTLPPVITQCESFSLMVLV